jgi:tRNA threonylcarbamoyl adenosine modification protein (Sua5/YciO/YrdC/YwlC family)
VTTPIWQVAPATSPRNWHDDLVSNRFETADETAREAGIAAAALAVQRGELVVLPTDTVYGVGADAFDPAAVRRLLAAKGRGREMPPPVLVSTATTLDALAVGIPSYARALVDELWPGPLTLVCRQQTSLQWDLGDTRGTVAVRMPDHEVALELLARTGPLAVSSANRSGMEAATDADRAEAMLGESVEVILDAGPTQGPLASTIVDATGPNGGRVLRLGAVSLERLNEIVASVGAEIVDEG